MRKSPLSTPHGNRSQGTRRTPYNWKLHGNTNDTGYQSIQSNNYQHFSVNNELQPSGDNFIPLNVSTPVQYDKYYSDRYSPANGRNSISPNSGWYNHRNNYHSTPRSSSNYPHSPYKSFNKHLAGQKRGGFRGKYGQSYILDYVDMNSFLENPWEGLVKKLRNSKGADKSEMAKNKSLSNSKLIDSDSIEKSESKPSNEINLNDSQCSKDFDDEYSTNTSVQTEDTELSKISTANNSRDAEIDNICSSQDSLNENACSDDKTHTVMQEKNDICYNISPTDTDKKDI